jgi:hypothetical protein
MWWEDLGRAIYDTIVLLEKPETLKGSAVSMLVPPLETE